jgi:hypothetical protein
VDLDVNAIEQQMHEIETKKNRVGASPRLVAVPCCTNAGLRDGRAKIGIQCAMQRCKCCSILKRLAAFLQQP